MPISSETPDLSKTGDHPTFKASLPLRDEVPSASNHLNLKYSLLETLDSLFATIYKCYLLENGSRGWQGAKLHHSWNERKQRASASRSLDSPSWAVYYWWWLTSEWIPSSTVTKSALELKSSNPPTELDIFLLFSRRHSLILWLQLTLVALI